MKVLARLFAAVLALGVAALLLLMLLAMSDSGLHWAYRIAAALVPGQLTIDTLEGRLLGPLHLRGVHYTRTDTQIDIGRIDLDWSPDQLLHVTLHIRNLVVDDVDVRYTSAPAAEPKRTFTLPTLSLPVYLRVDRAELNRLTVSEHSAGPTFELTRARIAADWRGDSGAIREFSVNAPRYDLSASGTLRSEDDYPLDLALHWRYDSGDYGVWSGAGRIQGDLKQLRVDQRVDAPLAATVKGTLSDLTAAPAWALELAAGEFNLRAIHALWPDLKISGLVRSSGHVNDLTVRADGMLRTAAPDYTLTHNFDVTYQDDALDIRRLRSRYGDTAAELRASGRVAQLRTAPQADLRGEWRHAQWPLRGAATVTSDSGSFAIAGGLADYRVQLQGEVGGDKLPHGSVALTGNGTQETFSLTSMTAQLLGGRLNAHGELRWQPQLDGTIVWQADGIDPGVMWPAWPGALHVSGSARAAVRAGVTTAHVELPDIRGELRGHAFDGRSRLDIAGERIELSQFELHANGNRVSAAGSLAREWDLGWTVIASDLGALIPKVGGTLRASGRVAGPRATPLLTASLRGSGLRFGADTVDQVDLVATLDTAGTLPSLLNVEASALTIKGTKLDHLGLRLDGNADHHRLQVSAAAPAGTIALAADGRYDQRRWSGTLTRLDFTEQHIGRWQLRQATAIDAGADSAALRELCLVKTAASLCASGEWHGAAGWQARLAARGLPLALAQYLLPESTVVEGTIDADATAGADAAGVITTNSEVRWGAGALRQALSGGQQGIRVGYRGGRLRGILAADALRLQLGFEFEKEGSISAELRALRTGLPAPFGGGHGDDVNVMSGRINASLRDLSVVPLFVAGVENTSGRLDVNLQLNGSWNAPQLVGEVALGDGRADLPNLGIRAEAVNLRLRSHDRNHISIDGNLRSGDGTLTVRGDARQSGARGWLTEVALSGQRIEVMHTAEVLVIASPDLRLSVAGNRIDLTGEVLVPEANIRLRELRGAVTASDDVILVTPEGTAQAGSRWQIHSQVRVRLGDFVRFSGFGLRVKLAGDMTLTDTPQQPTTATGELRVVEGEYRAYGQELTIERGRLLFFGGPVDNPGLDVRAVRKVDTITAGLLVRGTLKTPEVTIFSDPAMGETDALSYLVLGRPMSQATHAEGEQMYGAAAALGLLGGNLLSSQIGRRFGIDDLRIESGGGFGQGAVVIRHYLSPRLYISYGMGLFESLNVFVVNYQISKLWALQAESGTQSSADLIYTIERK